MTEDDKRVKEWKELIRGAKKNAQYRGGAPTVDDVVAEMNRILAGEGHTRDVRVGTVNHWFSAGERIPTRELECWALIRVFDNWGAWKHKSSEKSIHTSLTKLIDMPPIPAGWGKDTPPRVVAGKDATDDLAAPSASLQKAKDLFARLSHPKCLLCVEYRDLPRTGPEGKYQDFGAMVGRAIANGLCFAMFQPFGEYPRAKITEGEYHSRTIQLYLEKLCMNVRSTYRSFQEAAVQATEASFDAAEKDLGLEEVEKLDVADPLGHVKEHLALYEAKAEYSRFLTSGIQTRLFYCASPGANTGINEEVWEWVAAEGEDLFLRREQGSTPNDVIRHQFFPVVNYWREHGKLPDEIEKDALNKYAKELKANMNESPWERPKDGDL